MANILSYDIPYTALIVALAAFFVLKRLYWELTVGAARRKLIKENGCKPPKVFPHKGLLGKYYGYDVLTENFRAAKAGNFLETSRLRFWQDRRSVKVRVFRRDFILTTEPENVKTVLSTKFQDFGMGNLRASTLEPVFGNGIFTKDGESWAHSRAMLRPSFTRQQVGDIDVYERHIQHVLANIPKDGSTVDLQDLFFRMTMDTATDFLFGRSTNLLLAKSEQYPGAERFVNAFTYVTERMGRDLRTARLARFLPDKKRKEDSEFIRNFARDIIRDAIARQEDIEKGTGSKERHYVFLYELLKVTKDPYVLQSEIMNVLLAGRDTTASLLGHCFFQLAQRPDVWKKLQAEVSELDGKAPDYEALKSLKYVRWVLNETLRLFPIVPGNTRIALRDTVIPLGGGPDEKSPVFVPKGTPVGYSVWSMHRRTDFYGKDALEFKPERWEKLRTGWEYLPFNGGPRICIGQNFALTEASYALIRVLQHFKRIEPRDDRPWFEFATLTLACGNGARVGLYPE